MQTSCPHGLKWRAMATMTRAGVACVLCFVAASAGNVAVAEDHPEYGASIDDFEERAKILEMLVLRMRSNLELIETWAGVYDFVEQSLLVGKRPSPNPDDPRAGAWLVGADIPAWSPDDMPARGESGVDQYWQVKKGTCRFAIDSAHSKAHVLMECASPTAFIDSGSGETVWRAEAGRHSHRITTLEESIEFDTREMFRQLAGYPDIAELPKAGGRVAFRRTPAKSRGKVLSFDPRDLFCNGSYTPGKARFYSDLCERRIAFLRSGQPVDSRLYTTADSPPTFTERVFSKDGRETVTRYDGKSGFNVVSHTEFKNGDVVLQRSMAFKSLAGVYIPASAKWKLATESRSTPRFVRLVRLKTAVLNQPIDESEFKTERLGFGYGDRMVDEIRSRLLIHDGQEFVPAEGFVFDAGRVKD